MSLIADSLKKAQSEREQEPGNWAGTVLRSSAETTSRFPKSILIAVGAVPIVFMGIWFVLIPGFSEKSIVTQTADVSNNTVVKEASMDTTTLDLKDPTTDTPNPDLSEIQNKPVHPVEATVAPVQEEPILVSSGTLDNPPLENPVEEIKEIVHANEKTADDKKEEKETLVEPENIPTPVIKTMALNEKQNLEITPFTQSPSPLDVVASLTHDIHQEPEPIQIESEPVVPVVETPAIEPKEQTKTITFDNEDVSVQVEIPQEESTPEFSPQQMAMLDTATKNSGDITVIPDEESMDTMSRSRDEGRKAIHEKTRYFNIAALHHKRKDYFEALKYYDKAAKLDPGNAQIFNNRALVFKQLGRRDAAIDELLHAIHIDARYVKAYNNLGLLYYYSGNYLGAIKSFEKAVDIDPRNVESFNNLAILYKQRKQYAQAKNLYRKVILLEPDKAEAHYNLALLYEETGELSSAIKSYQLFVNKGSQSRPALAIQVQSHIKKLEEL